MQATRFESEKRNLHISRQFLIVLILLFVSLMIWTFITIGASQNESTISPESIALSKPLNPIIDQDVLEELLQKEYIAPSDISPFIIYKLVTTNDGKTQMVVPIGTSSTSSILLPSPTSPNASPSSSATPSPSPTPETFTESTPLPEPTSENALNPEGV